MRPRLLFSLIGLGVTFAAAEARAQTPDDPYEGMNRRFYASFVHTDQKYVRPLVGVYHALTPGPFGIAIHNFLTNLGEPVVIANDFLQARPRRLGRDIFRFVANSTAGIGGLVDVAALHGVSHHDNDFGITLGVWGVRPGPYLFLPFVGPTTVRDGIGMGVDIALNPLTYARFPGRLTLEYASSVVGGLDKRLNSQGDLDLVTRDAADPYATLRSVYLQSREAEVRGENAAPELPPLDDPAAPSTTPPSPQQPGPSAAANSAPIATAPGSDRVEMAEASDPNAPIATAFPCDTDHSTLQRFAAAN